MKIGKRFIDKELNANCIIKAKRNNSGDYICKIINDRYNSRNGETFVAHECYVKSCREIVDMDDLDLIENDCFCEFCRLPCNINCANDGVGQTEFWGVIGVDSYYSYSSDCCDSAVYKDANIVDMYDQNELDELYRRRHMIEG